MKHKIRKIYFVGIGGVGMSGIAEVLHNLGYQVSGSDAGSAATMQRLASMGMTVYNMHKAEHVGNADVVVISSAIKEDNPEVVIARERQIPIIPRAVMLAELMRLKQGIAVAGTHGKTTTTSLVTSILAAANLDPTYVIGGKLNSAGVNAKLGQGDYIVVEADESDASFLNLNPMLSVITNIDADHMDTYGHDFDRLKQAFVDFTAKMPFYGAAVVCYDDVNCRSIIPSITKTVLTYGFDEAAQFRAVNVKAETGTMTFDVVRPNSKTLTGITLNLPGEHNVLNALAAITIAWELDVPDEAIVTALKAFAGVGRRFQQMGNIPLAAGGSYQLVDDYGHHPVEMEATLRAARGAYPEKRLVLAFQPHRYTRTRDLFEDFVRVMGLADMVVLTEVYAAGETPIVAADGRSLARSLRVLGKVEPVFVENVDELPAVLEGVCKDGDLVLMLGAGSIGHMSQQLAMQAN
jgi:UDP-N-acetylmuramate--alanine ligase